MHNIDDVLGEHYIERLSLAGDMPYDPVEAAIHLVRYQLAIPYCAGKRVLDVACGEGYGALFLKRNGAASVDAVDVSPEAISVAKSLFSEEGVNFHECAAEQVDELFAEQSFDLIISLETIEHLSQPERFLVALKKLAEPDAAIIISCPNDHWYYPSDEEKNPFHVRKYTFDEFRELTTAILGNQAIWGIGAPIGGFANTLLAEASDGHTQLDMLQHRSITNALLLPNKEEIKSTAENCSYFFGIWRADGSNFEGLSAFVFSMNHYSTNPTFIASMQSELEKYRLQVLALAKEGELMTETIATLQATLAEIESMSLLRWVARRVKHRIPAPFMAMMEHIANRLRIK
uniref:Methyltransferase domain-containing protein n=1 Tax=Candidatus Kentrum sp. LPFa TaxID=2126335 RepID=A0A450W410_9GAMM|nr:MAG: Methyltransferase domain-containing protein [Candidatus Kentron sp. LPFa]